MPPRQIMKPCGSASIWAAPKSKGIAIADDGHERLRRRAQTPRGDYDGTLAAVAGLVRDIEGELGVQATVGIGIPGAISPATGVIKNANSTWLIGRPLADDLARMLDRPIRLANDANCFALSEAADGAAAGADVGLRRDPRHRHRRGIVVHGKVLTGANAIGGEWGHNPLPAPHRRRAAWPAVLLRPLRLRRDVPVGSRPRRAITRRQARAPPNRLRRCAAQGEPRALAALERYEERLARALATVVNILDPDVIVLGGGRVEHRAAVPSPCRVCGRRTSFRIASPRDSSARSTGTRAASAARRGYGRSSRPKYQVASPPGGLHASRSCKAGHRVKGHCSVAAALAGSRSASTPARARRRRRRPGATAPRAPAGTAARRT